MKLPEPHHSSLVFVAFRSGRSPVENYYTEEQMRQHWNDALEAAAKVCDANAAGKRAMEHYAALTYAGACDDCSKLIEGLKEPKT